MKRIALFFLPLALLLACDQQNDLLSFDSEQRYIYFAVPVPNTDLTARVEFTDSISYSFATDSAQLTEKKILIPVNTAGLPSSEDLDYELRLLDSAQLTSGAMAIRKGIIRAGALADTLYITIQKTAALQEQPLIVELELLPNAHFALGNYRNRRIRIIADDRLTEPAWWAAWQAYLGPYYREVYQKWMEIYYLGADLSPDLQQGIPGPVFYWNNMPLYINPQVSPVTFQYINGLRQYFRDTVVYPDNDPTKNRILIP